MFFSKDECLAHEKGGACNSKDHNQTLKMFVPESPKSKKNRVSSSSQVRPKSTSSAREGEIHLGKRCVPP
jgi:hypothetical protein